METIIATSVPALLKDMAKFEDVVTRTVVMKNASGAINLIALKRGQHLSEHLAPADAMVQILEGYLQFTIKGNTYEMKPGDFLLMQKGEPHSLIAKEDTKFLLTLLK